MGIQSKKVGTLILTALFFGLFIGLQKIKESKKKDQAEKYKDELIGYTTVIISVILLVYGSKSLILQLYQVFLREITEKNLESKKKPRTTEKSQRKPITPQQQPQQQQPKKRKNREESEPENAFNQEEFLKAFGAQANSTTSLDAERSNTTPSMSILSSRNFPDQTVSQNELDIKVGDILNDEVKEPVKQDVPLKEETTVQDEVKQKKKKEKRVEQPQQPKQEEEQVWDTVETKKSQQPQQQQQQTETKKYDDKQTKPEEKTKKQPQQKNDKKQPEQLDLKSQTPKTSKQDSTDKQQQKKDQQQQQKQKDLKKQSKVQQPIIISQQPEINFQDEDNKSHDSEDWVEIDFKKIGREIKPKEEPVVEQRPRKKDLISEEDKKQIQELERSLQERLQATMSKIESKQRSKVVESVSAYKVKYDPSLVETPKAPQVEQKEEVQSAPLQVPEKSTPVQQQTVQQQPTKLADQRTKVEHKSEPTKQTPQSNQSLQHSIIHDLQPMRIISQRDKHNPFFPLASAVPANNTEGQYIFGSLKGLKSFKYSRDISYPYKSFNGDRMVPARGKYERASVYEEKPTQQKASFQPKQEKKEEQPQQKKEEQPQEKKEEQPQEKNSPKFQEKSPYQPKYQPKDQTNEKPKEQPKNDQVIVQKLMTNQVDQQQVEPEKPLETPRFDQNTDQNMDQYPVQPEQQQTTNVHQQDTNSHLEPTNGHEQLTQFPEIQEPQQSRSPEPKAKENDQLQKSAGGFINIPELQDNSELAKSFGEVSATNESPAYQERKKQMIRESIEVTYTVSKDNLQILSLETMLSIVDHSLDIIKEQYTHYIVDIRKKRRQILFHDKNFVRYVEVLLETANDIFNMLQDAYFFIADALEVDDELFQQSYVSWSEHTENENQEEDDEDSNQFISRITYLQQELKETLKHKPILKQRGKEIVKYQLELIQNYKEHEVFNQILQLFQFSEEQKQLLPVVLSYLIEDLLFAKFSIEEEDKIKFIKTNRYDQELTKLQMDIVDATRQHFEVHLP